MKRVKIEALEVALVFRNGVYQKMLTEGTYWITWSQTIKMYDITKPFYPSCELNVLLQDNILKEALQVVEVKSTELVLRYENGLLKEVLTAGRYTYWKNSPIVYDFVKADISKPEITEPIGEDAFTSALLAPFIKNVLVESYEKALLFVNEQYIQQLASGVYYWWKGFKPIQVKKVDTRQQQLEINGQEILTRDKAALRVNAHATYLVNNVETALLHNKDYERQLYLAFQLALREYIGTLSLDELLERKDMMSATVIKAVAATTDTLGVTVTSFGMRDVILPGDVRDIMNQVLVAEKKAQANTIMRREETASTRSLLNTAKLMEENGMLFKLKEMEYVEKIADKINTISLSGNGVLIDQLRQIFVTQK
ncbi:SPFH domain / Band 7 family protein [Filimonas lacunae]|uniref:SPFH domain / Band 7 family protein n=1 Tax=Filimonas lacunae TaxID=477680 RepID=A0A173MPI0_9BACT|nr:slipin family protein [Filimonas lacunae]BAV09340.1 stomatin/prohibitin-family membrane protease subunit PA4582 [Filimonas lacunae]SIS71389.1 SPFH domain / Band 7 family protein [Filimonas lacunae]